MVLKFFESLFVGASIAAIPGPIFFELVRRTLSNGLKQGVLLVLGEFTGNVMLLLIIFFGAAQFLTNHAVKQLFYIIGGLVLIWVSLSAFKLKAADVTSGYGEDLSGKKHESYITGVGIALSSPIVAALWVSLSSSYLNNLHDHVLASINILLIALGFLVFFLPMAYIVHKTRHRIPPDRVVLLSRVSGTILVIYALFLFRGAP